MDLNVLWFILISVLFCGFFFLEGFDYGVCILMPFIGKNDVEKRMLINSIGPFWDGNEVWLITAGGAMFAAFPVWYATMFSGYYLALFLMLIALIFRGVAFEFRGKVESKTWKKTWDLALFLGSLIPALLWGVALSNLLRGVPINNSQNYAGGFFDLISVYSLLAGLTGLVFFIYHGAVFITLRTKGIILDRAKGLTLKLGIITLFLGAALTVLTSMETDLFKSKLAVTLLVLAAGVLTISIYYMGKGKSGKALMLNGAAVIAAVGSLFAGLYPNVMVSSIDTKYNLTISNASSSPYTLKIMTIVALTLVPVVVIYQGWTYWIFRKRVTADKLEY
ncbi:MAG: cytochrome d ubiquinol oxidase subunit II [Clostridiaceae bacterium]|nr:cytochrome d ubiquinol oxidase subunit II [Clostridiaceae bacterium]